MYKSCLVFFTVFSSELANSLFDSMYIYKERESNYGVLQSTEALCVFRSIFNFKSKIIDLNHLI
jgi:hypothetical protein